MLTAQAVRFLQLFEATVYHGFLAQSILISDNNTFALTDIQIDGIMEYDDIDTN